jgi:hypothetical protein
LSSTASPPPAPIAALLALLEAHSRERPDRVLRLEGHLPGGEPFELLIYRGFSSSTTHPTAFDPDQPALAEGSEITTATLLEGPLKPGNPIKLAGPAPVENFLVGQGWD